MTMSPGDPSSAARSLQGGNDSGEPAGNRPGNRSGDASPSVSAATTANAAITRITIAVQTDDFDLSSEVAALRAGDTSVGAVACFVGTVRDLGGAQAIAAMTLEHYPGMTERSLRSICDEAARRWPLAGVCVVHRIGELHAGDQIVLVAVTSRHRGAAFEACEFVMDYLKTRAPFWKKERGPDGERWVDARDSDDEAARRWARQAQQQQQQQ